MTSKTALVTGASGGIGKSLAEALARDGHAVTLVARSQSKLEALAAALPGDGHRVLVADLLDEADIASLVAELEATHYDVLVNNAGVGRFGRFEEIPLADHLKLMRLNLDTLVTLAHAYLARTQPGDALINVASTLAIMGFPMQAVYAATKAFVLSLSESVWFEQKDRGVYVMGLCPGATRTNFFETSEAQEGQEPPSAVFQTPDQVAAAAMKALAKRRGPAVISGGKNKFLAFLTRFMTRKRRTLIMGGFSPDHLLAGEGSAPR